jgi:hypothetical protein
VLCLDRSFGDDGAVVRSVPIEMSRRKPTLRSYEATMARIAFICTVYVLASPTNSVTSHVEYDSTPDIPGSMYDVLYYCTNSSTVTTVAMSLTVVDDESEKSS